MSREIAGWQITPIHLDEKCVVIAQSDFEELQEMIVKLQEDLDAVQERLDNEIARVQKLVRGLQQMQCFLIMGSDFAQEVVESCGIELV